MLTVSTLDDLTAELEGARRRLAGIAHRTPVVTSATLDALVGATVHLKCESFQRMGAFKFRGAWNLVSQLPEERRRAGVVAFSSGNHAQAVALVARLHGIPATIVMPSFAPRAKLEATRGYGAEVVFYDRAGEGREAMAERIVRETGRTLVPPFDHPHIIGGQGTAAAELFEDTGPLDFLLVPVGGGGLISGCAVAARARSPECRVIGVEPEAGDDAARSFRSGERIHAEARETIADGARTPSVGVLNFEVIRGCVADVVTVPDDALVRAMRFAWERLKLVIEPTGALGLAALIEGRVEARGRSVGVVVSGGNVDLSRLHAWFAA